MGDWKGNWMGEFKENLKGVCRRIEGEMKGNWQGNRRKGWGRKLKWNWRIYEGLNGDWREIDKGIEEKVEGEN